MLCCPKRTNSFMFKLGSHSLFFSVLLNNAYCHLPRLSHILPLAFIITCNLVWIVCPLPPCHLKASGFLTSLLSYLHAKLSEFWCQHIYMICLSCSRKGGSLARLWINKYPRYKSCAGIRAGGPSQAFMSKRFTFMSVFHVNGGIFLKKITKGFNILVSRMQVGITCFV